jgi:hypothetical protein
VLFEQRSVHLHLGLRLGDGGGLVVHASLVLDPDELEDVSAEEGREDEEGDVDIAELRRASASSLAHRQAKPYRAAYL